MKSPAHRDNADCGPVPKLIEIYNLIVPSGRAEDKSRFTEVQHPCRQGVYVLACDAPALLADGHFDHLYFNYMTAEARLSKGRMKAERVRSK